MKQAGENVLHKWPVSDRLDAGAKTGQELLANANALLLLWSAPSDLALIGLPIRTAVARDLSNGLNITTHPT